MDFSVLMSVYRNDDPRDFKTALESVTVCQTLQPSQIVIVQDGAVPKAIDKIIDDVKQQAVGIEFTVLKKSKNEGLAAALNDGLKLCENDWVARMDSDDISAPDRFKKQIGFLSQNKDISAVGGAIAEFEREIGDIQSVRHVELTHDGIKSMARTRTPMNHVSVMYSKKAVSEVGGYSLSFGRLEDYKLWIDLITAGKKMANLEDVLVNVRIGNGFIARRSDRREIRDWDMLQRYLLEGKMIGRSRAMMNRIYIRVFTYMPSIMKKIAYKTVLRKS